MSIMRADRGRSDAYETLVRRYLEPIHAGQGVHVANRLAQLNPAILRECPT